MSVLVQVLVPRTPTLDIEPTKKAKIRASEILTSYSDDLLLTDISGTVINFVYLVINGFFLARIRYEFLSGRGL